MDFERLLELRKAYALSLGDEVTACYYDNGVSRLTLDRPALNQLEANLRIKEIDVIVVKDIARIGRKVFDTLGWVEIVKSLGVSLVVLEGKSA